MQDLLSRFNARVRLIRRKSTSTTHTPADNNRNKTRENTLKSRSASYQLELPTRLSSTKQQHPPSPESDSTDISNPSSSTDISVENEVRQPSAVTIVDSQILHNVSESLSLKDRTVTSHTVEIDSPSPPESSSDGHSSIPPITLQEPSPPVPSIPSPCFQSMQPTYRKIWVKRPNASATLVQINRDDLVDDVRDMILRKYANSLGRSFDSPDVTLRIIPREQNQRSQDRTLGPEEEICSLLDALYPGGQTVDEALLIDVPHRRTPKPSPRILHSQHLHGYYNANDETARPTETGTDYFPPMPMTAPTSFVPSPAAMTNVSEHSRTSHPDRAMTILTTGHAPPLPSPGGSRKSHHSHRPKLGRHHTSSPTTMAASAISNSSARPRGIRHDSSNSDGIHAHPPPPTTQPMPTPPAPLEPQLPSKSVSTPPAPRVSSPRPSKSKKRPKPKTEEPVPVASGLLDNSVPPINVLIVEDNMINLRVLGAFMQRLKVRWQRAMNGREAVTKWRAGGFHLVLMDIQLPIMNGLDATKEIRRLERVNSIGVFSSVSTEAPKLGPEEAKPILDKEDALSDPSLFKSPVIIVALTASSLQSDKQAALAAGCNDFLTKPVNFLWLERKVKEWGCMQALIDFDGWRKWKDFAAQSDSFKQKGSSKNKEKKGLKMLTEESEEKSSGPEAGGSSTS